MGISYIEGMISGPKGKKEVRFLIDSGAPYTLLPYDAWKEIGLSPKREATFTLQTHPPAYAYAPHLTQLPFSFIMLMKSVDPTIEFLFNLM